MDPEMSLRRDGHPTAVVSVGLGDGRVLSRTTKAIRGDAENPASYEDLVSKFRFLTTDVLGINRTEVVIEMIANLENLPDVRKLTTLLGV